MPVYLSYGNTWLKLKDAALEPIQQRGRRKKKLSAPYALVAESVDKVNLRGLVKVFETVVPSTKVSRFAARLVKEVPQSMVVLIEPYGEDYIARFYAPRKDYEAHARQAVDKLFRELKLQKGVEEEEEVEEEVGEEEENEE